MKLWVFPPDPHLNQWILDQFPKDYRGYALDIGASDGISSNTTWTLEKRHGWTCVCVEPNPRWHDRLLKERAFVERVACDDHPGSGVLHVNGINPEAYTALRVAHDVGVRSPVGDWKDISVPVTTADLILKKWGFPKLDALCIDTEGTELEVLKGCDLNRWRPKAVIVEAWDQGQHDEYLKEYRRVGRSEENDLYQLVED